MGFSLKLGFFQRFFGGARDESRSAAKERLKGALVGDRSSVAPNLMPSLEADLIAVLDRYFKYDSHNLKLQLLERDGIMNFGLQLPLSEVHRQAQLPSNAMRDLNKEQRLLPSKPKTRRGPRNWPSAEERSVETEATN